MPKSKDRQGGRHGGLFGDEAQWQEFRERESKRSRLSQQLTKKFMEAEAAEKKRRQKHAEAVEKAIDAGELPPKRSPRSPNTHQSL